MQVLLHTPSSMTRQPLTVTSRLLLSEAPPLGLILAIKSMKYAKERSSHPSGQSFISHPRISRIKPITPKLLSSFHQAVMREPSDLQMGGSRRTSMQSSFAQGSSILSLSYLPLILLSLRTAVGYKTPTSICSTSMTPLLFSLSCLSGSFLSRCLRTRLLSSPVCGPVV